MATRDVAHLVAHGLQVAGDRSDKGLSKRKGRGQSPCRPESTKSITFFCPDAPTTSEQERCVRCEWLSMEAGNAVFECADGVCRYGWIEYPTCALPEANFTVANAVSVLRLLGEAPESEGEWSATDLDRIIRAALVALNDRAAIATAVVPASTSCGAARVVEDGNVVHCARSGVH